jgi:WD40 repeat protein
MEALWHRVWKMDGSDSGNPIRGCYSKVFVDSIMALTFSPSGDTVAFGGWDQMICIKTLQDKLRKSIKTPLA